MSDMYRIKENLNSYTKTERKIAVFILEHKEFVINSSAQQLADKTDTSAAAVVRFAKRFGYKGFTHLKVSLAQDTMYNPKHGLETLTAQSDSTEVLISKTRTANSNTFENTYQLLRTDSMDKAIEHMTMARKIFVLGIGGSNIVAMDLYQKLVRIEIEAYHFTDFHLFLSALSHANEDDVIVTFSYGGETREVVRAQCIARSLGVTCIATTHVGETTLGRHSDIVIHIPTEEHELRLGSIASRFAMFVVSDILYLGVAKKDMNRTYNRLIRSRTNMKKFQK